MNNKINNRKISSMIIAGMSVMSTAYADQADLTIEAEDFDSSRNCRNLGTKVGYIKNGSWIGFSGIDFGQDKVRFSASVSSNTAGGTLELRADDPVTGELLASDTVYNTGGWNTFHTWVSEEIDPALLSEASTIFLTFSGGSGYLMDVDHFTFHSSDVGCDFQAINFDFESKPDNNRIIRKMSNDDKVGYLKSDYFEYFVFEDLHLGGAETLTVTASSGSGGGTLFVRSSSAFNPSRTLATVEIPNTGGWNSFQEFTVPVSQSLVDRTNRNGGTVYFVIEDAVTGYQFDVQSFRFDGAEEPVYYAMNVGGSEYTDPETGYIYQADSTAVMGPLWQGQIPSMFNAVTNIYNSQRYADIRLQYDIPVENGTYTVTLKFQQHSDLIDEYLEVQAAFESGGGGPVAFDSDVVNNDAAVYDYIPWDFVTTDVVVEDGILDINLGSSSRTAVFLNGFLIEKQ